jgi:hypothetical protein
MFPEIPECRFWCRLFSMFGKRTYKSTSFRKEKSHISDKHVQIQTDRTELKTDTETLSERTGESDQKKYLVTDSQGKKNPETHESHSHRHHSRRNVVRKSKRKSSLWQSVLISSGIVVFFSVFLTVFGVYADDRAISETARIVFIYSLLAGLLILGMTFKTGIRNLRLGILTGIYLLMYIFTLFLYYFHKSLPGIYAFAIMSFVVAAASVTSMKLKNQLFIQLFLIFAHFVPLFLLEAMDDPGVFPGYIAAINLPVVVIALGQKWKDLMKTSFLLVWLISIVWIFFLHEYNLSYIPLLFWITLFFLMFYVYFILYQIYNHSKLTSFQRNLFIANLLIYYISAISILLVVYGKVQAANYTYLITLFLLLSSLLAYAVAFLRKHMFSLNFSLFITVLACSLYFLLPSHFVPFFILGGSFCLLYYARSRKQKYYEKTAYVLFLISFVFLVYAAVRVYLPFFNSSYNSALFFNQPFLSSLLYLILAGFMYRFSVNAGYQSQISRPRFLPKIIPIAILIVLMLAVYISLSAEIVGYFDNLYTVSVVSIVTEGSEYPILFSNGDLLQFKSLSIIGFTLLFLSLITYYLLKKFRNNHLAFVNLMVNGLAIALYLTLGFLDAVMLRDSFLNQDLAEYYHRGYLHVFVKYILLVCVLMLMFVSFRYSLLRLWKKHFRVLFDLVFFGVLLLIVLSEWLYLSGLIGVQSVFGSSLTLIVFLYGACLLLYGFIRKKIHLRIAAVVLFTLSVVKFLVLDLQFITPFVQTVLFMTLGISFIIISLILVIRNSQHQTGRRRRR